MTDILNGIRKKTFLLRKIESEVRGEPRVSSVMEKNEITNEENVDVVFQVKAAYNRKTRKHIKIIYNVSSKTKILPQFIFNAEIIGLIEYKSVIPQPPTRKETELLIDSNIPEVHSIIRKITAIMGVGMNVLKEGKK